MDNYPARKGLSTAESIHLLVLDTNRYGGNFESALVAYVTGSCEDLHRNVGSDVAVIADEATKELPPDFAVWAEHSLLALPDDEHGWKPFKLVESPVTPANQQPAGVAIAFDEEVPQEYVDLMFERAQAFCVSRWVPDYVKDLRVYGYRVIEEFTLAVCRLSYTEV